MKRQKLITQWASADITFIISRHKITFSEFPRPSWLVDQFSKMKYEAIQNHL